MKNIVFSSKNESVQKSKVENTTFANYEIPTESQDKVEGGGLGTWIGDLLGGVCACHPNVNDGWHDPMSGWIR
jgi:hypothetical protein